MAALTLHDVAGDELGPATLYAILALRAEVFVVEQACAYQDLDGQDLAATTRHVWLADDAAPHQPHAYLRVLPRTGGPTWVGRVVTRPAARGQGLAGRLLRHVLDSATGEVRIHAQAHLEQWYAGFGFEVCGPPFDEDGIPHVPMRRAAP